MSLSEIISALVSVLAAMTAFLASLAVIARAVKDLRKRDDVTDARVDVQWAATARRGALKARKKGKILVQREPEDMVTLQEDARRAFKPIAGILADIYRKTVKGPHDEGKFSEALETELGDWLIEHICDVHEIEDFECVAMALVFAREEVERQDAAQSLPAF